MTLIVDAYCTPGGESSNGDSALGLLEMMDRAGIDRAVIAPSDREIAVANVEGNQRIERLAASHPGRFVPTCTANPWYGPAACAELQRAHAAGARGGRAPPRAVSASAGLPRG
ncbi:MAG: hypothetical protein JW809_09435 [Pirellulales bacterium]|nr:hypothetical protein [Pirellulales bacterium]